MIVFYIINTKADLYKITFETENSPHPPNKMEGRRRIKKMSTSYLFQAKFNNAGLFKKCLEAIKYTVKQNNFEITKKGFTFQAMDDSHVALVYLNIPKELLRKFKFEKNALLGVNIDELCKMLKGAEMDDKLLLSCKEDENNLNVTYKSHHSNQVSEYSLKLKDIRTTDLAMPEVDYEAVVKLKAKQLKKIFNDCLQFADVVSIKIDKDSISFITKGEIGEGTTTLRCFPPTNEEDEDADEENAPPRGVEIFTLSQEPFTTTFSLKYLINFCKVDVNSGFFDPYVTLRFSKDQPLLVEYTIMKKGDKTKKKKKKKKSKKKKRKRGEEDEDDDERPVKKRKLSNGQIQPSNSNESGFLRFHLAPKIENDEENDNFGFDDDDENNLE